jgi:hypothetical protein
MARRAIDDDLRAIEAVIGKHRGGASAEEIAAELESRPPRRTLQYWLKHLVDRNRLVVEGTGRAARYRSSSPAEAGAKAETQAAIPLSGAGAEIQAYVRQPVERRGPVGYDRAFLDSYRPNISFYLSPGERLELRRTGTPAIAEQPAGTYATQLLNRLLIDLSWNSSRLEGNTYSLLDTKRLIELGEEAEDKAPIEAQMILNHKDAIEFLVSSAEEIGFNRYTILNLHALLANNLLGDPAAAGRLRHIRVAIEGSVFHPLEPPQIIEEYFDQVLATAAAIEDPFEQAFFVMVQLPYLQPFDDVNKRVSRLGANIPFIKLNLSPLSFEGVPRATYTEAMLGVYELNRVELLKDVFIWAYQRSAARYAAVRQSLGEPDPFRLRHRLAFRALVAEVIRRRMNKKQGAAYVAAWTEQHVEPDERERFREVAEGELLGLHEGNFARYQVRPSEFAAWQAAWSGATSLKGQA